MNGLPIQRRGLPEKMGKRIDTIKQIFLEYQILMFRMRGLLVSEVIMKYEFGK